MTITRRRRRDGHAWMSGHCGQRVVRGGSWYNNMETLRSANRYRNAGQKGRDGALGFRLAQDK